MAIDKTAQAALVTELRARFNETESEYDAKWLQEITIYRTPYSTPIELKTIDALLEGEDPSLSIEVLSGRVCTIFVGSEEYIVFGAHTKEDTAGVFSEYEGEE
jgi:hypothetical protein